MQYTLHVLATCQVRDAVGRPISALHDRTIRAEKKAQSRSCVYRATITRDGPGLDWCMALSRQKLCSRPLPYSRAVTAASQRFPAHMRMNQPRSSSEWWPFRCKSSAGCNLLICWTHCRVHDLDTRRGWVNCYITDAFSGGLARCATQPRCSEPATLGNSYVRGWGQVGLRGPSKRGMLACSLPAGP